MQNIKPADLTKLEAYAQWLVSSRDYSPDPRPNETSTPPSPVPPEERENDSAASEST